MQSVASICHSTAQCDHIGRARPIICNQYRLFKIASSRRSAPRHYATRFILLYFASLIWFAAIAVCFLLGDVYAPRVGVAHEETTACFFTRS